jgi:hypothetical protein
MSSMIGFSKNLYAALVAEQALATELPVLMPNLTVLVDGTTMTSAEVSSLATQHISAEHQLLALKSQVKELQSSVLGLRARMRAAGQAVKLAAAAVFGNNSQNYRTLGFTSPKARKITTGAEKALAAARSLATRVLRGTKGARQKASIHGVVPAATTEPVATPAAPATAATPATVK